MEADTEKSKQKDSKISQQNHIVEVHADNGELQYNCTACCKTFRSRSQKYYHLNCNQPQSMLYSCEHCDKTFARQSQWKYHIGSHRSPFNKCLMCQKIFSNPFALKKHMALHRIESKLCPHCDKTFKKKISLEQHIAAQHLNQLQYGCAFCDKKYASKSSLQLHLQTHEKKRFDCSYCGKLFQRNSILNQHLKRHFNTNCCICSVCQKVFRESSALARHRKIHEENIIQYHCKLCDKNILRRDNMTRHLNTIHPEEKFEDIIEIVKPTINLTNESSSDKLKKYEESSGVVHNKITEENVKRTDDVFIIENKLLQKPFEERRTQIDLVEDLTKQDYCREFPFVNKINVITSAPAYETAIILKNIDEISHECNVGDSQQMNTKLLPKSDVPFKSSSSVLSNETVEQSEINLSNENQTQISSKLPDLNYPKGDKNSNITNYLNQNQSNQICEPPKTKTISSVIRSIGNVKKDLTSHLIEPVKSVTQPSSMEYKHKKYCRNNYNIDLYRKILGCDDEDDDDENEERQGITHHTHSEVSSTPVHWRKSFKNNYETKLS